MTAEKKKFCHSFDIVTLLFCYADSELGGGEGEERGGQERERL